MDETQAQLARAVARLERIKRSRRLSDESWSAKAKLGERTAGMIFARHRKLGAGPNLEKFLALCQAADVPAWAVLHPDEFVVETFLADGGSVAEKMIGSDQLTLQALKNIARAIEEQTRAIREQTDLIRNGAGRSGEEPREATSEAGVSAIRGRSKEPRRA